MCLTSAFFVVPVPAVRAKGIGVKSTIKPFTQQHHQLYMHVAAAAAAKFSWRPFLLCVRCRSAGAIGKNINKREQKGGLRVCNICPPFHAVVWNVHAFLRNNKVLMCACTRRERNFEFEGEDCGRGVFLLCGKKE